MYTVTAADNRHIQIYNARTGSYISRICVTSSGCIIGSPMVSSDTIAVTVEERGHRYLVVYNGRTLGFLRKQSLG